MVKHNAIEIGISLIIIMVYLQPSKIKLVRVEKPLMVKLWLNDYENDLWLYGYDNYNHYQPLLVI